MSKLSAPFSEKSRKRVLDDDDSSADETFLASVLSSDDDDYETPTRRRGSTSAHPAKRKTQTTRRAVSPISSSTSSSSSSTSAATGIELEQVFDENDSPAADTMTLHDFASFVLGETSKNNESLPAEFQVSAEPFAYQRVLIQKIVDIEKRIASSDIRSDTYRGRGAALSIATGAGKSFIILSALRAAMAANPGEFATPTILVAPGLAIQSMIGEIDKYCGKSLRYFWFHNDAMRGRTTENLKLSEMLARKPHLIMVTCDTVRTAFQKILGEEAKRAAKVESEMPPGLSAFAKSNFETCSERARMTRTNFSAAECEPFWTVETDSRFFQHANGYTTNFLARDALFFYPWSHMVCDEAHALVNRTTLTFIAVNSIYARYRYSMSGTLYKNRKTDYLAYFANMRCEDAWHTQRGTRAIDTYQRLGMITFSKSDLDEFRALSLRDTPLEETMVLSEDQKRRQMEEAAEAEAMIRALKRASSSTTPELHFHPEKMFSVHSSFVEFVTHRAVMNDAERRAYQAFSSQAEAIVEAYKTAENGSDQKKEAAGGMLQQFGLLRQCCNGVGTINPESSTKIFPKNSEESRILSTANVADVIHHDFFGGSAKMCKISEILFEWIPATDKCILFSSFPERTFLVLARLLEAKHKLKLGQDFGVITGKVGNSRVRTRILSNFVNNPACRILMLSTKLASAMNLQCANHVIFIDPWWCPAVERQGIARVDRNLQRKKVYVHRILVALGYDADGKLTDGIEDHVNVIRGDKVREELNVREETAVEDGDGSQTDGNVLVKVLGRSNARNAVSSARRPLPAGPTPTKSSVGAALASVLATQTKELPPVPVQKTHEVVCFTDSEDEDEEEDFSKEGEKVEEEEKEEEEEEKDGEKVVEDDGEEEDLFLDEENEMVALEKEEEDLYLDEDEDVVDMDDLFLDEDTVIADMDEIMG